MFKSYSECLLYLEDKKPANFEKLFQGNTSLDRVKSLLQALDNPQEKIKIIHIAGTSGKGSTAVFISKILECCNKKVGLTVSPSVYDFLERFQINSTKLSEQAFTAYLNELYPTIIGVESELKTEFTFYELVTVLAFYIFWSEKVDYAVIETGLGGLMDATNTITNPEKVVVITPIDFDHTEILGKKLSDIATQKAGIIQNGNTVFSAAQGIPAKIVIEQKCLKTKSKLVFVSNGTKGDLNLNDVKTNEFGTKFNVKISGVWINDLILRQTGDFQAENSTLALGVAFYLGVRDTFPLDIDKVKETLKSVKIPGRFEIVKTQNKEIVLDMAHNPHKIKALIRLLQSVYPGQKFDIVFSTAKTKDATQMLKILSPITENLYLTNYNLVSPDSAKASLEISQFDEIYKQLKGLSENRIYKDPSLENTLQTVIQSKNKYTLVIGSALLLKEAKYYLQPALS